MYSAICGLLVVIGLVGEVAGHGRLIEPPSRSSAWRFGFQTPRNDRDNELFCGGYKVQQRNRGRCGICGDLYNGRRQNEAGGKYATGTIVRTYKEGEVITITAQLTANHKGWFEYRICPHNDVTTPVTKACLDQHVLLRADNQGRRLHIPGGRGGNFSMRYKLPVGLVCSQCVIQWKYHTGKYCSGCGPQEKFYGCADVAVVADPQHTPITMATDSQTSHVMPTVSFSTNHGTSKSESTVHTTPKRTFATTAESVISLKGDHVGSSTADRSISASIDRTSSAKTDSTLPASTKSIVNVKSDSNISASIDSYSPVPTDITTSTESDSIIPASSERTTSPTKVTYKATTSTVPATYRKLTTRHQTTTIGGRYRHCRAVHGHLNDAWCANNCARNYCPKSVCTCDRVHVTTTRTTPNSMNTMADSEQIQSSSESSSSSLLSARVPMSTSTSKPMTSIPDQSTSSYKHTSDVSKTTAPLAGRTVAKLMCKTIGDSVGSAYMDRWCTQTCATEKCPSDRCKCTSVQVLASVTSKT